MVMEQQHCPSCLPLRFRYIRTKARGMLQPLYLLDITNILKKIQYSDPINMEKQILFMVGFTSDVHV